MSRSLIHILGPAVCAVLVLVACKKEAPAEGACTPEGGLACNDGSIQICRGGTLETVGKCPGGCDDESGVVRCKANNGVTLSPVGAVCREGLTLCGVGTDVPSLVTCKDGVMTQAAECPSGCIDEGDTGGLFCLGPKGGLRFHVGFQCPGFKKGEPEFACGPDGASVLRCEDGKLTAHEGPSCASCYQAQATGAVTCKNATGESLDVATGKVIPPLEPDLASDAATPTPNGPKPPPGPLAPAPSGAQ